VRENAAAARPEPRGTHLACWTCGARYAPEPARLLCNCGAPLEQKYDLNGQVPHGSAALADGAGWGVWRYRQWLPVTDPRSVITLGEGGTPLIPLVRATTQGLSVFVKDEGRNPTGSFKARGASVGVSRLRELGWQSLAMPTVGSGGSAWAAYAARAGVRLRVGLPQSEFLPQIGLVEPKVYGSRVDQFPGTVEEAFQRFREGLDEATAYVGAFEEPYRLEGEKTILYEIVEQLDGCLPDYVIWPTGGGVGLVGLAKAYDELVGIGAVSPDSIFTVIAAQHTSSGPIATALRDGLTAPRPGRPSGIAPGVCVGRPFAGEYVVQRVRASVRVDGETASDREIRGMMVRLARDEGIMLSPEGALAVAVVPKLRKADRIRSGIVVCVNTATGLRYPKLLESNPG
jgi:threonine synthase